MINLLKKIAFFILIMTISIGFYWVLYLDKDSKQDSLEYALRLIGNDLLAKVEDTDDRRIVQNRYDEFLKSAQDKKIPPEKIEEIAVKILNLSRAETTLTTDDAEKLFAFTDIDRISHTPLDSLTRLQKTYLDTTTRWNDLNKRILSLYKLQTNLNSIDQHHEFILGDDDISLIMRPDSIDKIIIDPLTMKEIEHLKSEELKHKLESWKLQHQMMRTDSLYDSLRTKTQRIILSLDSSIIRNDSTALLLKR